MSYYSGKFLTVPIKLNRSNIFQWSNIKGADNQLFYIIKLKNGNYKIKSAYTDKCVDIFNKSLYNGAKIIQVRENITI